MHRVYQSKTQKVKNYSYSLLDQIGKGFSSIVYRGCNDQTKQTVAIKVIDMKGIRDSATRQMLNCQIEALTTLKHQNIMKCYDVIKDQKNCYIITEFCNGGDLSDLLKKKRKLAEVEVIAILKNIVDGYVQIGEKGFFHRDLKLANVLMHNSKAKIADFGFAKRFTSPKQKQKYNVGSPLYMSPQALQKNLYSLSNDIWSIGIMTYELLHGKTPWQCKTEKQLINKMTRIPVSFSKSVKVSENLQKFIKKCLEVSDLKRMSLEEMKNWQFQAPRQEKIDKKYNFQNKQNIPLQANIQLVKKNSMPQTRKRTLSEITNKIPITQKDRKSYDKKPILQKKSSQEPPKDISTEKLTKSRININNNKITKEIILFRLYFKTWEKLNGDNQSSLKVQKIVGNQTIRLVTLLKKLICSGSVQTNKKYNLYNYEDYVNSITNPSIKKFKEVISEYFNRYTQKIKMQILKSADSPSQVIKDYLMTSKNNNTINSNPLLSHWLLHLINASADNSRQSLQKIIEPQRQITVAQIQERIEIMAAC